jgi:hypothetical protein
MTQQERRFVGLFDPASPTLEADLYEAVQVNRHKDAVRQLEEYLKENDPRGENP